MINAITAIITIIPDTVPAAIAAAVLLSLPEAIVSM